MCRYFILLRFLNDRTGCFVHILSQLKRAGGAISAHFRIATDKPAGIDKIITSKEYVPFEQHAAMRTLIFELVIGRARNKLPLPPWNRTVVQRAPYSTGCIYIDIHVVNTGMLN